MRKENILRKLLNDGRPSLGTHIVTPWPGMFEVIGNSGMFDYVEYVSEYSTWTLPLLDDISRTMELFPKMATMIKVEEQARGILTTRALDSGFQSVLFSDCRSAEDVRQCIRLVRAETPDTSGGIHGVSARRHSGGYGMVRSSSAVEDWVKEMKDVVIVIMIEKKSAMENLEEILSVKGIDMVQFGAMDYSVSVGRAGQLGSPETQKAEREMIKLALKKGVAPRVETGNLPVVKEFIDMGVRHFCVGTDLMVLSEWCIQQGKAGVKSLLDSIEHGR